MKLYKRGSVWAVSYTLHGERQRVSLRTRDVAVARVKVAEMEKEIAAREMGIATYTDARTSPTEELVESFELELRRRGRSRLHIDRVVYRLGHMLKGAGGLGAVTPRRILNKLQLLFAGGLSPKTCNEYRSAVHSFFTWLVKTEQWPSNPATVVESLRVTEKTRTRRALTEEELLLLVSHAGSDRGGKYLIAARTGLRRGEMAQWRWRDIDLENRIFRVRAVVSKDRREATLPLCQEAAKELQKRRSTLDPDGRVFAHLPRVHTLKADLKAAGLEYKTAEGVADFHSLRHAFNTHLARAGVPLAMRQHLMRHSDPKLTANVYMHLELEDARMAIDRLQSPPAARGAIDGLKA